MPTTPKLKTYVCCSMRVRGLPRNHYAANGNTQKTVVVRTTSKKRVGEITGATLRDLAYFGCDINEDFAKFAPKPDTIYYRVERTLSGYIDGWAELVPETK